MTTDRDPEVTLDECGGHGEGVDMAKAYEFRIAGRLSAELLAGFEPTVSRCDDGDTVFVRAVVDDGELFGVIGRCETYGLHLLGVQQLPSAALAD